LWVSDADTTTSMSVNPASMARAAPRELGISAAFVTAPPLPFVPEHLQFKPVVVAILCWSIAILMTKKLPLWIGWFGIALSLLTATVFISGTAVNNVHGLRIFVTSIVVWILLIGAVLCKEK